MPSASLTQVSPSNTNKGPRVAIVHYWLVNMRGGEKVLEALCELYPQADIFTHIVVPGKISDRLRGHTIKTTFIQKLPFSRSLYQKYLSLMPMALEQLDLSEYDLVISSESGPAKGVITRPDALHICYCHSPMRYIWDQYPAYKRTSGRLVRMFAPWLTGPLRQWDVTSAARVDHFIANSSSIAQRIRKFWRREAEVIAPPVDVKRFSPNGNRDDFYLHVGELVPYKRVDLAVAACTSLNRRLVIIGDGPEYARLRKMAGPTVEFLGRVPDSILDEHYSRCRALLFPAEEDFGIVPVEAMATGAPVIAFNRGGSVDTVVPGKTGVFFENQTPSGMIKGIVEFELNEQRFHPEIIANFAARFDRSVFLSRISEVIDRELRARQREEPSAEFTMPRMQNTSTLSLVDHKDRRPNA